MCNPVKQLDKQNNENVYKIDHVYEFHQEISENVMAIYLPAQNIGFRLEQ